MRALVAGVCCLAIGLVGGFYLGQNSHRVFSGSVPAANAVNGSRERSIDLPAAPPASPAQAQTPANVQPPPPELTQPIAPPDESVPTSNPGPISLPIQNLRLSDLLDTFYQGRPGHIHEATDIMAPLNTPVYAVSDGTVKKLFVSKAGGNTIYEFDPTGTYCYYYAHLDHYAPNIHEGMPVRKGDLIAYVGSTGDADPGAPHLHFAIFRLGPEKLWWKGTAVNPYPVFVDAWHRENGR